MSEKKFYALIETSDPQLPYVNTPTGYGMRVRPNTDDIDLARWCAKYPEKDYVIVEVTTDGYVLGIVDGERPAEPGPAPTEKEMRNHAKAHPDKDGYGAWVVKRKGYGPDTYFQGEGYLSTVTGDNDATWLAIDQRGMPATVKRW